ncbi:GTP-binding protein [Thermoplasma volcanium GSS1]|uniref:GTP-binding protein n=1 Tax=Thermoplasma volcanium (strain ATCC 51530 / DSM 4299 / JCM 9571 / NBRC 15438 / GSS1) TaxID=273116 RepID=Q979X2_THEVO|nr:redox-regulated ATPase YchF [Thermoplasma volcanium]BAB60180.1 GTP-binding protein [Thermoplasma volcanium GSS1]
MSIRIGLIGEPNVGKSTFFSAATENEAEINNFPFTTIKPNLGMTYFVVKCPEVEISGKCNPREGYCENGNRHIPVQIIDVPGLIEGASEGKGMGNEFLDNIRDVDSILLLFDASAGDIATVRKSIEMVKSELLKWISQRIYSDWDHFSRKSEASGERRDIALKRKLSLFGISEHQISEMMEKDFFPAKLSIWTREDADKLALSIIKYAKPLLLVGNKSDLVSPNTLSEMKNALGDSYFVSAEYELALKRARKSGLVSTTLNDFAILGGNEKQKEVLAKIRDWFNTPGIIRIHDLLQKVVRDYLHYIIVYPVYDESKWTDKSGNVLPDAFVMPYGSTSLDLAYKIHTDIGEGFIRAVNARTRMVLGKDYILKDGDVIKIISKK